MWLSQLSRYTPNNMMICVFVAILTCPQPNKVGVWQHLSSSRLSSSLCGSGHADEWREWERWEMGNRDKSTPEPHVEVMWCRDLWCPGWWPCGNMKTCANSWTFQDAHRALLAPSFSFPLFHHHWHHWVNGWCGQLIAAILHCSGVWQQPIVCIIRYFQGKYTLSSHPLTNLFSLIGC